MEARKDGMQDAGETLQATTIEFYTAPQHEFLLREAPPVPASQLLPTWYRETEAHFRKVTPFQVYPPELKLRQNATIRACPGIRDHVFAGFILPLWSDFAITFEEDGFRWESPHPDFVIDKHDPDQYARMPKPGFPMALKFMSPWYCRTAPGYSIRILPCFYHFEQLWWALPGVVNSDTLHATHLNVLFEPRRGQIVLPQGTPFAHVIPFRRERYTLDLHVGSAEDMAAEAAMKRHLSSFFHDADIYPGGKGTS